MSTKPLIVFLVPVDTLTDESIEALHTAIEKAAEIMKMFAQYDSKVQACEYVGVPLCSVCISEQLNLNLSPHEPPRGSNQKVH
jgi:hypothetical protein